MKSKNWENIDKVKKILYFFLKAPLAYDKGFQF